jgi:hypothetical protein
VKGYNAGLNKSKARKMVLVKARTSITTQKDQRLKQSGLFSCQRRGRDFLTRRLNVVG